MGFSGDCAGCGYVYVDGGSGAAGAGVGLACVRLVDAAGGISLHRRLS